MVNFLKDFTNKIHIQWEKFTVNSLLIKFISGKIQYSNIFQKLIKLSNSNYALIKISPKIKIVFNQ